VRFDTTIPAGAPTCHFTIWRAEGDEARVWDEATRSMERKALRLAQAPDAGRET
jgi:hypothetical protein